MSGYVAHWVGFVVAAAVAVAFVRRARRSPRGGRLVAGNVLVGIALCAGAAAGAETYLRFVFDGTTWQADTLTTRAWFRRHVRLNAMGFRDVEFELARRPGVHRVAFLGDSFTYGYGIADPTARFSDRVRAALDDRAPGRYEVWNVGSIGADTARSLTILDGLLTRGRVDRVVLVYSPNDVEDLLPANVREVAVVAAPESGLVRRGSFLVDLLAGRWELAASDAGERYFDGLVAFHEDDAAWARQRARLDLLSAMCRGAGVRLQVVLFPLVSHWGADYPFDVAHERVRRAFGDASVEVLDLRDAFRGHPGSELVVNAFDPHPNARAHALAAAAILASLLDD